MAKYSDDIYVELILNFRINNVGRAAAYKWSLVPCEIAHGTYPIEHIQLKFNCQEYPVRIPNTRSSIPLDTTILPGCSYRESMRMGIAFRPSAKTQDALQAEVEACLGGLKVKFRLATENSPGEPVEINLGDSVDAAKIVAFAVEKLPEFFDTA